MKRCLTVTAVLLFSIAGSKAHALGLGRIATESALNEPFRAKIELTNIGATALEQIYAGIGSESDYELAGVKRSFIHADLTFEAVSENGKDYLIVTSSRSLREPYMNFLVQVRWPQGKLLREYTVLLDLPLYSGKKPTVINVPRAGKTDSNVQTFAQGNQQSVSTPAPRNSSNRINAPTATGFVDVGARFGREYRVASGDSIWRVAKSVATGNPVSVHQAMLSIWEENPDAFTNGDINQLKRDALIKVPSREQMEIRSHEIALGEFDRVRNGLAPLPNLDGSSGLASNSNDNTSAANSSSSSFRDQPVTQDVSQANLSLTVAELDNDGNIRALVDDNSKTVQQLTDTNSALQEALDAKETENEDLRERLRLMQEQLELADSYIALNNPDAAKLEVALSKSEEVSEELKASLAADALVANQTIEENNNIEQPLESSTNTATADSLDSAKAEQAKDADAVVTTPEKKVAAPIVRPAPKPTLLEKILGFGVYIGGGLLVLLLGGLLWWKRRQNEEQHLDYDELDDAIVAPTDVDAQDDDSLLFEEESKPLFVEESLDTENNVEDNTASASDIDGTDESGFDIPEINVLEEDHVDNIGSDEAEASDEPESELESFDDLEAFFEAPDESETEQLDVSESSEASANASSLDNSLDSSFDDDLDSALDFSLDTDTEQESLDLDSNNHSLDELAVDASETDNGLDFSLDVTEPEQEIASEVSADVETDIATDDADENMLEFDLGDFDLSTDESPEPAASSQDSVDDDENSLSFSLDLDDASAELDDVSEELLDINEPELDGIDNQLVDEDTSIDLSIDETDLDDINLNALDVENSSDTNISNNDNDEVLDLDIDLASDTSSSIMLDESDMANSDNELDSLIDDLDGGLDADELFGEDDDVGLDDLLASFGDSDDTSMSGADELSSECDTKLELAKAYIDMGDKRGAKELLEEVVRDGGESQISSANDMLETI